MNKIILGTVQFGSNYGINNKSGKPSEEQVFSILNEARRHGIDRLDTSEAYGDAINVIGKYHIKHKAFKILNKFIFLDNNIDVVGKVEKDLKILGINSFDVYSYHSIKDYIGNYETRKILLKFKKQKLINKIGISVYSNQDFETAINSDVINVIQIPFNIFDNHKKKGDLILKAKRNGKEIYARSVFLQGLFFMDENNITTKLKPLVPYLTKIRHFCKGNNISTNELALKYVIANTNIDGVLLGVDNVKQLAENLRCLQRNHGKIIEDFVETLDVKETDLLNPVNWNII